MKVRKPRLHGSAERGYIDRTALVADGGFNILRRQIESDKIVSGQKLTNEQLIAMGRLWLNGAPYKEIGKAIGVSTNTVWRWMKRIGRGLKERAPERKRSSVLGRKIKCLCGNCPTCLNRFRERQRQGLVGPFLDDHIPKPILSTTIGRPKALAPCPWCSGIMGARERESHYPKCAERRSI